MDKQTINLNTPRDEERDGREPWERACERERKKRGWGVSCVCLRGGVGNHTSTNICRICIPIFKNNFTYFPNISLNYNNQIDHHVMIIKDSSVYLEE